MIIIAIIFLILAAVLAWNGAEYMPRLFKIKQRIQGLIYLWIWRREK